MFRGWEWTRQAVGNGTLWSGVFNSDWKALIGQVRDPASARDAVIHHNSSVLQWRAGVWLMGNESRRNMSDQVYQRQWKWKVIVEKSQRDHKEDIFFIIKIPQMAASNKRSGLGYSE